MKLKSGVFRVINIFARVFGLTFTAAGAYFAIQGIYYVVQPAASGTSDTLGFPPSFRPLVIAAVLLIIGVHFIRGNAHRSDLTEEFKPRHSTGRRTHSWWTGEPLDKK